MPTKDLQTKAINTIRFLSADAVQQAKSGHPGLPMGTAAIAYTIWTRHLQHNPKTPNGLTATVLSFRADMVQCCCILYFISLVMACPWMN